MQQIADAVTVGYMQSEHENWLSVSCCDEHNRVIRYNNVFISTWLLYKKCNTEKDATYKQSKDTIRYGTVCWQKQKQIILLEYECSVSAFEKESVALGYRQIWSIKIILIRWEPGVPDAFITMSWRWQWLYQIWRRAQPEVTMFSDRLPFLLQGPSTRGHHLLCINISSFCTTYLTFPRSRQTKYVVHNEDDMICTF